MFGAVKTRRFLTRLGGSVALLAAIGVAALTSGDAVHAARPNPVVDLTVLASESSDGTCTWTFQAAWDADELRGPKVTYYLYESVDGGAPSLIAAGFGVPDSGLAVREARDRPAASYSYDFQIVKGQNRVVAADTLPMTCAGS